VLVKSLSALGWRLVLTDIAPLARFGLGLALGGTAIAPLRGSNAKYIFRRAQRPHKLWRLAQLWFE
jgi:hypothetical protein